MGSQWSEPARTGAEPIFPMSQGSEHGLYTRLRRRIRPRPPGPLGIERWMLNIQSINEAYVRVQQGGVRYRFVIDMASLKNERV